MRELLDAVLFGLILASPFIVQTILEHFQL